MMVGQVMRRCEPHGLRLLCLLHVHPVRPPASAITALCQSPAYELEHNGRTARVRFYNSGELHFATKGDPLVATMMKVGDGVVNAGQWQIIVLRPQAM
jgi:hypothetical protein